MKKIFLTLLPAAFAAVFAGCAVGPDYQRPAAVSEPAQYKAEALGSWKAGQPLDNVPKGAWWEIFGDTNLNGLESQALAANQELKAAVARVDQARAVARVTRSELLPHLDLNPSYTRQRYSPNADPSFGKITANTFSAPLDLSYEVDLWGRVRRAFEGARDDAEASLASFYNVLLTLQSDVAENYFTLRSLDAEIATVTATVDLRKEQVRLVRSRFEGGIGSDLDVSRAETELANTQAELAALVRRRDRIENAIAILAGQNPSTFKLAALLASKPIWNPTPPGIPAGLPSDLLERRPDVAAAERQLASANAKIGVAKGAFFPVLTLTGSGGYLSGDVDSLFNWDSRTWSIGPSLSLPIFAGGRNLANLKRARSAYDEYVALYRQQVLVAFGDVENSLSAIRHLTDQAEAQSHALTSSRRAASLAEDRYRSGIVAYIEVVDANRDALTAERASAQLAGERLIATVQLVKALGGGWNEKEVVASVAPLKAQPNADAAN